MRADESKTSAIAFLEARVEHFAAQGVRFKRLLTDNGPADRSKLFNETCQALGIKHTYTRPYTPQTNGKVERFIQTCLHEWAYGRIWANSKETSWLHPFLDYHNNRRAHSALVYRPPASRLGRNNLLTTNS
jgi:transposase InsO family protein